jgi:hypothetical protein
MVVLMLDGVAPVVLDFRDETILSLAVYKLLALINSTLPEAVHSRMGTEPAIRALCGFYIR